MIPEVGITQFHFVRIGGVYIVFVKNNGKS